ncbi:MAG: sigma-54-dependent Fis family transcriptional regulator [Calditrichaeota bacterium]|nr:MAG: sigma-54-dependent Fis family transcriptional regulator [Calditrichota bacterium]
MRNMKMGSSGGGEWPEIQGMPWETFCARYNFHGMVSRSTVMDEIRQLISRVSATDVTVLVFGESGTGKELIARCIHRLSKRAEKPFIPVDCNALPGTLLESELFGYEKGAFTGADKSKPGLLEFAQGGTFFLDELTNLDLTLQSKLLRVLQERQFRRIGASRQIPLDVRIVSATNVPPDEAVRKKQLREDLYYRLNVVPIYMPPLRKRREDIPLLVRHYAERTAQKEGLRMRRFSAEAVEMLCNYDWPGNVRELKNLVERLQILCECDPIRPEDVLKVTHIGSHLRLSGREAASEPILRYHELRKRTLEEFEKKYIERLMRVARGNITLATRISGLTRPTIYRMVRQYLQNGGPQNGRKSFERADGPSRAEFVTSAQNP